MRRGVRAPMFRLRIPLANDAETPSASHDRLLGASAEIHSGKQDQGAASNSERSQALVENDHAEYRADQRLQIQEYSCAGSRHASQTPIPEHVGTCRGKEPLRYYCKPDER